MGRSVIPQGQGTAKHDAAVPCLHPSCRNRVRSFAGPHMTTEGIEKVDGPFSGPLKDRVPQCTTPQCPACIHSALAHINLLADCAKN